MEGIYTFQLQNKQQQQELYSLEKDIVAHEAALNTLKSVIERTSRKSKSRGKARKLQSYLKCQMANLEIKRNHRRKELNVVPNWPISTDDPEPTFDYVIPSNQQYMNRESVARIQRLRRLQLGGHEEYDDDEEDNEEESNEVNVITFQEDNLSQGQTNRAKHHYKYMHLPKCQRLILKRIN